MRFTHVAELIYHRPWFITAEAHSTIRSLFEHHIANPRAEGLNIADLMPQRKPLEIDDQGMATIHALGPLGKGLSKMEQSCGATSFEQIREDHAQAISSGARAILLHIDSPGGTVTGTPEIAELIASKPVPTVAYTEDMMASAAYYMAAGADAIVASQSAEVGSIGVLIPWVDSSEAYARQGIRPDPIVNTGGDLKAMGFGGKLSDTQRQYLQESIDRDFGKFKAHVTRYRNVSPTAMRGQTMSGESALSAGLINKIGNMEVARETLASFVRSKLR
jgi:signal peptide peptidase SppA